jgi:hypothetical protein
MTSVSTQNVFLRHDTIFGTCQTIGDEFGFNPNWLRAPLAAAILASPTGAIGFYLGLSIVVLVASFLFRSKATPALANAAPVEQHEIEANDDQRELIAA